MKVVILKKQDYPKIWYRSCSQFQFLVVTEGPEMHRIVTAAALSNGRIRCWRRLRQTIVLMTLRRLKAAHAKPGGKYMLFKLKRSWKLTLVASCLPIMGCSTTDVLKSSPVPVVRESKLVEEQVALSPSFNARLTSIRFFEGERSKLAFVNDKKYETRFAKTLTRTIYTEIDLDYSRPKEKVFFPIMLYFRQNGKLVRVEEIQSRIDPQWTSSSHTVGAGYFEPGEWGIGDYEVDVYINSKKAATAYFAVY
jgi:hypothetical protein